jgi:hypothetical protein
LFDLGPTVNRAVLVVALLASLGFCIYVYSSFSLLLVPLRVLSFEAIVALAALAGSVLVWLTVKSLRRSRRPGLSRRLAPAMAVGVCLCGGVPLTFVPFVLARGEDAQAQAQAQARPGILAAMLTAPALVVIAVAWAKVHGLFFVTNIEVRASLQGRPFPGTRRRYEYTRTVCVKG